MAVRRVGKVCAYLSVPFLMTFSAMTQAQQPNPDQGAQSAPDAHLEGEDDRITVIGERLRRAGGAIRVNGITGRMTCRVTHPTGDDRIDAAACDVALRCARENRRDREAFNACVETGYEQFIDDYLAD
jgi:hypothetical protein